MKTNTPTSSGKSSSLSEEFIYSVLGQEDLYSKQKNKVNMMKLIELYRKMVEFYSQKNDKISIYFMDKITQLSMEIPSLQEPEEKMTVSMIKDSLYQEIEQVDPRFKHIVVTPTAEFDPDQKKKQRSKNAQIAIQVSKLKKRTNARTILKSYYEQCVQNNNLINADLQMQRKQLEQKLIAIHRQSLQMGNKRIFL